MPDDDDITQLFTNFKTLIYPSAVNKAKCLYSDLPIFFFSSVFTPNLYLFFTFLYWSSFRVFFIFSSVFTSFLYLYICQTTPRIPPKGPTHIFPSTSRICILILRRCGLKKTSEKRRIMSYNQYLNFF